MSNFAVIFDMDGVIIDSNNAHRGAIREFLANHGLEIEEESLIRNVFGRTNADWIPFVFGRELAEEELTDYAFEKEAIFRKIFEEEEAFVEGVAEFVYHLKRSEVPIAIGTSAPMDNVAFTLQKLNLENAFDVIVDDAQITFSKPNPEVFIKCAQELGFPTEKCIIFEDSMSGIEAAKRSGAKVIGVTTTHSAYELRECDMTIEDFKDLNMTILKELF
ncbi:HAD family phosphatase [Persicobacter sp. CCB-QB2]|uniref:HAD family hydrolase n=1 Tax=Persicobacter sp. CCB-QB2 TaxID=1561025 RepID=UPI0006A9A653|nr:HAD family phosphatase [Persicobacter sp. CCB-QB2]